MILLSSKLVGKACSIFSICKATFKLSKLVSKRVLGSAHRCCMILLSSKLVGKACSIHHGLLGFLLCILGSNKHAINFSLQRVNRGLQLALSSHITSIDCLHVVDCTTGISNVSLELALSTISSIKKSLAFFNFSRESCSFSFRDANLFRDLSTCTGFIFKELDCLSQLTLVALDGFQTLRVSLVCVVESNFKLIDFSLQLFLNTERFSFSALFSLN